MESTTQAPNTDQISGVFGCLFTSQPQVLKQRSHKKTKPVKLKLVYHQFFPKNLKEQEDSKKCVLKKNDNLQSLLAPETRRFLKIPSYFSLSWWWFQTNLKKITVVKLDHETPIFGNENQKCLKSTYQVCCIIKPSEMESNHSVTNPTVITKTNNENIHPHNFPPPTQHAAFCSRHVGW